MPRGVTECVVEEATSHFSSPKERDLSCHSAARCANPDAAAGAASESAGAAGVRPGAPLAIGLMLRDGSAGVEEAVRRAARDVGLSEHLDEAVADVSRALATLRAEGLARPLGADLQIEYPVAAAWDGGQLLGGYIDLVGITDGVLAVVDFKTDAPPAGAVEAAYPEYVAQVRLYGRLLELAGVRGDRRLRCGLLFTGAEQIWWVN